MEPKIYKSGNKKGQIVSQRTLDNLKLGRMTEEEYEAYKKEHDGRAVRRKVKCSTRGCNKYTLKSKGSKYRCFQHKQIRRRNTAREWSRVSRLRKVVSAKLRQLMPEIIAAVLKAYEDKFNGFGKK